MKRLLITLAVTALLSVACGAYAQNRYSPPGTNPTGNNSNNKTTTNTNTKTTTPTKSPTQANPDPTGLTLAFSGAAAAVGYVMRRKRNAS